MSKNFDGPKVGRRDVLVARIAAGAAATFTSLSTGSARQLSLFLKPSEGMA